MFRHLQLRASRLFFHPLVIVINQLCLDSSLQPSRASFMRQNVCATMVRREQSFGSSTPMCLCTLEACHQSHRVPHSIGRTLPSTTQGMQRDRVGLSYRYHLKGVPPTPKQHCSVSLFIVVHFAVAVADSILSQFLRSSSRSPNHKFRVYLDSASVWKLLVVANKGKPFTRQRLQTPSSHTQIFSSSRLLSLDACS
jgi:hypothetical protein